MNPLQHLKDAGIDIALLAALDPNRAIGVGNALPWHVPEDLQRFKSLTLGHTVLMGRKTFDSIGRALPKRRNVVLTRDLRWNALGAQVLHQLSSIRVEDVDCSVSQTLWIIGGAELYTQSIAWADRLELTWMRDPVAHADAYFPAFELEDFEITAEKSGANFVCDFVSYRRRAYTPPH